MFTSLNLKALFLSIIILVFGLGIWELATPAVKSAGELTEYE